MARGGTDLGPIHGSLQKQKYEDASFGISRNKLDDEDDVSIKIFRKFSGPWYPFFKK